MPVALRNGLSATKRVHFLAFAFLRVGATQLFPLRRPGSFCSRRKVTAAAPMEPLEDPPPRPAKEKKQKKKKGKKGRDNSGVIDAFGR